MSYPKKLLRLRPTKGLVIDTPPWEVGDEHYTDGINVLFRKGFAGRVPGYRAVYTQNAINPVMHLLNVRVDTTNYWVVWGTDSVYAYETSNATDIEGSALQTVVAPYQYTSTLLNGVPVFTNSLDGPQYWTGDVGVNFASLPDFPASTLCKSIVAFKYHLFAFDIDGPSGHFESQILWSDAAEPGDVPASWTPAADNEAGDTTLSDTPGPIMCGLPLRGTLMIYKRSSTYACDYVGGNEKFSFQLLFSSSGALTRHSVCDINGQHFVVGDGDIFITDGTNRKSVAQGRVKDALFASLDQDNYQNLFTIFNRTKNEVWICYPSTGNTYCDKAIVYDVANDAFGLREFATPITCAAIGIVNDEDPDGSWSAATYTWDVASAYWSATNFSLANENLVTGYGATLEMQDTADLVSFAANVAKNDMTMGEPERVKFVRRAHVRAAAGVGTLYVRVGAKMDPNDAVTWSTEVTLAEGDSVVDTFAQGRYISVEVRSEDENVWLLSGIDLEYELRGYH
jgi:hypothetical protein